MFINVPEEFLHRLLDALKPAADACEINGPAFYMLAQEAAALDIDVEDITLGQLADCYERSGERYNRMHDRLNGVGVKRG